MNNLRQAHAAYKTTRRQNNAALWELCVAVYHEGRTWAEIARELQEDEKTVRNWGRVGFFIKATDGMKYESIEGPLSLADMWARDILAFDHLLRAANKYKPEHTDPFDILEFLYLAMTNNTSAETLEMDLEDKFDNPHELARYSAGRIVKTLDTHAARLNDKRVQRAAQLLRGRIREAYE